MKYYLIGIKGTGMSALALMLFDLGNEVIGSDVSDYYFTEDLLREKGIKINSFGENNIKSEYSYIIGNAYDKSNFEVNKIIECGYSYSYYNEFISKLEFGKKIACAGTHGKTTTTYFITRMLKEECSYIIGDGEGKGFGNDIFVFEACEYKDHFLEYKPDIGIISNIELDHTDYFKNTKQLINSFKRFGENSKILLINGDNKYSKFIAHKNKITFGFKRYNKARIKIIKKTKEGYFIKLHYLFDYNLFIPFFGKHMINNYISSYLSVLCLGIKPKDLSKEMLPKRRMNSLVYKESIIVNDYAHHPTEIKSLLEAIKMKYPKCLIKTIFQPHTYERTLAFKKQFKKVLKKFDDVYLLEVFTSKRESFNESLQRQIDNYFRNFKKYKNDTLKKVGSEKTVWVFLGAGLCDQLINQLDFSN